MTDSEENWRGKLAESPKWDGLRPHFAASVIEA
jgi:hypothetical protein